MLVTTKNVTLNGQSTIELEGQKRVAATMTAVLGENGSFSKSENVIDLALYEANKAAVQEDMKEFSDMAYELASGIEI
mgnify:CR=1 FL=1